MECNIDLFKIVKQAITTARPRCTRSCRSSYTSQSSCRDNPRATKAVGTVPMICCIVEILVC